MKQTSFIMGMPITIEIVSCSDEKLFKKVFDFFRMVDKKFSPFKKNSEVSLINCKSLKTSDYSFQMKQIIKSANKTKQQTDGYFDVYKNGIFDPSGIVKGWAILEASKLLKKLGQNNFYIEAGGDIQVSGLNKQAKKWKIGIKNPFNLSEIVKVLEVDSEGIATSGTYERGDHIYNPIGETVADDVVSLTVIGDNIYDADRFATAAFAMGENGIYFIDSLPGFEGLLIKKNGMSVKTNGFDKFII
jgi:thiamine biosynthesis lipoprotein